MTLTVNDRKALDLWFEYAIVADGYTLLEVLAIFKKTEKGTQ